jgi:hypothetical protein
MRSSGRNKPGLRILEGHRSFQNMMETTSFYPTISTALE